MSNKNKHRSRAGLTLLNSLCALSANSLYASHNDVYLVSLTQRASQRQSAQLELLRRHAPLMIPQVLRSHSNGCGGAELGDYETLAMVAALQSYDEYDETRKAAPSTLVYVTVLRRLSDAQRRTALESNLRWPEKKIRFRQWLNGDFDHYPKLRAKFEREHGVTAHERADMRLHYAHLMPEDASAWPDTISLEAPKHNGSVDQSHGDSMHDINAPTADIIINSIVLNDAISDLTDADDRRVSYAFVVENMTAQEISDELQMPVEEVRARLRRSRGKLMAAMA